MNNFSLTQIINQYNFFNRKLIIIINQINQYAN